MKKLRNELGITVIQLTVIVLILLTLAAIVMNMLLGENGIIKNAKESTEEYKKELERENILLILSNGIDKKLEVEEDITVEDIIEVLEGKNEIASVTKEDEDRAIIITDKGYIYEAIIDENDRITIESIENLMRPVITAINITNQTENSVSIEVITRNTEEAKYKYSYKEEGEEGYTQPVESQNNTYTYTDLQGNKTYNIKVEVENNEGKTDKKIDVAIKTLTEDSVLLASKVAVGDYVAYNATNNYSYESPVGTGPSHGNGDTAQTLTSKSSIKWRVLSKDTTTGEVILISEGPIKTSTGINIDLQGAIGYLYAEEELNRLCAIYGHGEGANTSKIFECQTGDVVEGVDTVTLTGSGARSINVEDINKICNVTPSTALHSYYGKSTTHKVVYPTKKTTSGYASAKTRTDVNTVYSYSGSSYLSKDSIIYQLLFRDAKNSSDISYWLASRAVEAASTYSWFYVLEINGAMVTSADLCTTTSSRYYEDDPGCPVRPIVYLKPTVETSGKNASGAWVIVDKD